MKRLRRPPFRRRRQCDRLPHRRGCADQPRGKASSGVVRTPKLWATATQHRPLWI